MNKRTIIIHKFFFQVKVKLVKFVELKEIFRRQLFLKIKIYLIQQIFQLGSTILPFRSKHFYLSYLLTLVGSHTVPVLAVRQITRGKNSTGLKKEIILVKCSQSKKLKKCDDLNLNSQPRDAPDVRGGVIQL